jgi:adenosylcobinamide-phosphate synthase
LSIAVAVALDGVMGEPPGWAHPVVGMGKLLDRLEALAPDGERGRLAYGGAAGIGLMVLWGGLGWLVERLAPWPVPAWALKATFAGRVLLDAARRVEDDLAAGDLDQARADLRWLVSRQTGELDAGLAASAAIESLAENFVDSWVGPLLAYTFFGLGGAYAYRAANTADAMWGYRGLPYEWLGKVSARLDDVLNWLPARLGALLLVAVGPRRQSALQVWRRDARLTASPNAGQPMAAMAGQLNVRLEKRGHYVLLAEATPPSAQHIAAARGVVARAMLLTAVVCLALRTAVNIRARAG